MSAHAVSIGNPCRKLKIGGHRVSTQPRRRVSFWRIAREFDRNFDSVFCAHRPWLRRDYA